MTFHIAGDHIPVLKQKIIILPFFFSEIVDFIHICLFYHLIYPLAAKHLIIKKYFMLAKVALFFQFASDYYFFYRTIIINQLK